MGVSHGFVVVKKIEIKMVHYTVIGQLSMLDDKMFTRERTRLIVGRRIIGCGIYSCVHNLRSDFDSPIPKAPKSKPHLIA